jgi:tetratricopeptide (TPR) repeat protein
MEGFMRGMVQSLQGRTGGDTPLDRAQALVQQAFEAADPERRIALAREALAVCPDCADAYVLLAENTRGHKKVLQLYEQGVAAGERALWREAFERDAGHFWGLLETRPYMRARLGLAHALWVMGRRDEAVGHLQEMLRLNPGDNQGIRYTLAGFLLFLDRDDDLERLLAQYPDEGSAAWAYTRALLALRRHGDTAEARQLLKQAQKANKHVPAYLLGEKLPSDRQPSFYSPGDDSEALEYVGSFMVGWKSTPGAIAWLRSNVQKRKKKAGTPPAKGPLGFVKEWLNKRLPRQDDVWQADVRQMPNWLEDGGQLVRPWVVVVASRTTNLVLGHQMVEEKPAAAALWDTLVQAMQHPLAGEAHRPSEIQVKPLDLWEGLRPHLQEIGTAPEVREELDLVDRMVEDMFEHICGKPRPGLLDAPGVTPETVAGFYAAAAELFRRAPWKKVGYEAAIRVECDKYQGGPWYAVLMGQSGLTAGLAVYEDLGQLRRLWAGEQQDEENARQTVATSVTFGEPWELAVADVDAAQRYGWQVARPDAYPSIFHKERGMSMRPPLAWELELLEGCLRAIPDFIERRRQDDPTREEMTVPVASGELRLALSWVVEPEEEE